MISSSTSTSTSASTSSTSSSGSSLAPVSSVVQRSIVLLSFATFASTASQRICDAMLPELSRVFSVSLGQAAQVVSVFAVTYGIAQLAYGPLGDRLGKYRVITFATFGAGLGSIVAVLAGSLDMLLVARVLMSLGAAALIPLSAAWVGDMVPTSRLQEMLTRTGLGSTVGLVTGQLLGGLLTDALGWRWCFAFMAVLFTAVAGLLYMDLRRQGHALAPAPTNAEGQAAHAARPGFITQALAILTGPWSRIVLIVAVIEGAVGFGVISMWASHLHHTLGLSLSMSGGVVALFGVGGMLYMLVGSRLIRRFGPHGLVSMGGVTSGVCACLLAFTPHWLPAVAASVFAGFGFFMLHNTMQATAAEMAPQARGTAVSLFASCLFLGQSIGVVMAASLLERVGSSLVIAGGGVVLALLAVYFGWALKGRADSNKVSGS
jgi:MFS transporter, YNFM family, putative membrane transport protein